VRLRAAVLSAASPGPVPSFAFGPITAPYAGDMTLIQDRPSAARVGDQVYVAWESSSPADASAGEQVFVTRIALDPSQPNGLAQDEEMRLPVGGPIRWNSNVHLASSPLAPSGALMSVWESADESSSLAVTDLMLDFRPSPFVFLPSGGDR
jgi:hypothetical protein